MSKKAQSQYHELVKDILWTFVNEKDIPHNNNDSDGNIRLCSARF